MQQHINHGRQQDRQDQGNRDGALRVLHFTGHRNDRCQAQIGEDNAACRNGHLHARQAERGEALGVEIFRFEEGEQHADDQQRHDKFEYADQVIGHGEGLHASVVEHEKQAQQAELQEPAQDRRVTGAGLGQLGEPCRGVLASGDYFNCHQAGERDQGDKTHQIPEQRAMGVNRVTNDATGAGQGSAQFAVNDAQQQHGKTAQQPGKNPCRACDCRHMTGCKQPAGTEDGTQTDKGQVHQ